MTYQQILDKNTTPTRPDVATNQIVVLDYDLNADGRSATFKLCDGKKIMVLHVTQIEAIPMP